MGESLHPDPKGNDMTKKTATPRGVVPQEKAAPKGLTPKQLRFVDEYLIDLNATQAAVRSGYSKKTAGKIGFENLSKPEIAQALEAKRKELANKAGITRERILAEMAKLAFSDTRQLFAEDGTLLPPHKWPDGAAGAVASLEVVEMVGGMQVTGEDGPKHVPMYTHKVKLWDKGKQLEGLMKHLGMEGDKPPVDSAKVASPGLDALAAKLATFVEDGQYAVQSSAQVAV